MESRVSQEIRITRLIQTGNAATKILIWNQKPESKCACCECTKWYKIIRKSYVTWHRFFLLLRVLIAWIHPHWMSLNAISRCIASYSHRMFAYSIKLLNKTSRNRWFEVYERLRDGKSSIETKFNALKKFNWKSSNWIELISVLPFY